MADTGWVLVGAGADAGGGGQAWTSVGNVTADDGAYAGNNTPKSGYSNYLHMTGLGLAIPAGATIDGIEAQLNVSGDNAGAGMSIYESVVQLIKAGSRVGSNLSTGAIMPSSGEDTRTYGGSANLWGTTWTPGDVDASNFGLAFRLYHNNGGGTAQLGYVDAAWLKVHYTAATAPANNGRFFLMF